MDTTDIEPGDTVKVKAEYFMRPAVYEVKEVKGNAALIKCEVHAHGYWIPLHQLEKVDPGDQHKA